MSAAKFTWEQLESEIADWMKSFSRPGLDFRGVRQCIPGFPTDGFRADGLLTNTKTLLTLEVEVRQTHPDTNVGKYWLLAKHYRYEKAMLFHVYTPRFDSYGWRKNLGEFYAERMSAELPFEYVLLDRRSAIDCGATLDEIRAVIEPRIHREFSRELA